MPEIAPLRPGDPDRLGPYRLVGLLGEGGQGSVFLGEESPQDDPPESEDRPDADDAPAEDVRRVAVKLLHARLSGDARARARFAAELRVAQRVAAFCTARILDSDVEGDRPYIVSEYIEGPSLSEVLTAEGPRSGADLDRLAIGTMTALAAIHQAGVVHRDFKPANVLLAPDGPRVIDFGIARALDATGTLSSAAVGTPAYMAPEQISGGPIGPQADIFAWGATMIYAATGRPAFGQDSIAAVMHRILNFPPDLGSLAEPLRGLVQSCLSKQAAHRPSSQQVLIHLLNLAGSLPQAAAAGQGGADAEPDAIINHGAEVVSTHTGIRLASVSGAVPTAPPPPAVPSPSPSPSPFPQPNAWPPPPPFQQQQPQQWGGPPGTWPGGAPRTGNGPGTRKKPGIGVLAGAGSAALVALVLIGTTIVFQLQRDGDRSGGRTGGTGRTGGEVRMALNTVSATDTGLSPSNAGYGTERLVAKQLFTGLVEPSANGTFQNRLAAGITPDATCTSWKIQLRPNTTFSNGEPVTPESFIRGWTRAAQAQAGLASLLIGDIRGFQEASTRKTGTISGLRSYGPGFQVDLKSPDCEFPQKLGDPMLFPVPGNAGVPDNDSYNDKPIGNGPFKVDSYVKDRTLTLVRNDSWAFGKAKLDRIVIDLTTESTQKARTGFSARLYQWAALDSTNMAGARGDQGFVSRTLSGLNYLAPITTRGPMASDKARLAVSYAIDRKALSTTLYGGAYPAATGIVPPAIPGFGGRAGTCPSCDRYDPARARTLAQEASLGPGTKVRLYTREVPSQRRWGDLIQSQLTKNLGWQIELKTTTEPSFGKFAGMVTAKDASGLAAFAWRPDYPSAHNLMRPLLAGDQLATADNGLVNFSGWRNAQFDQLISDASKAPDANTRLTKLRDAERVALDQMALIPLLFTGSAALRSDKLVRLEMDYEGDPTLATAAFK
ncbi:hypothetical protein GCM10010191_25760 [Actinomadura vinacea]|uniref:Protein kinase domain-containing protein n=1 Tax=Actinomadura vinacea TaxID=115336 RepID=A0ABN3IUX2_9ACTN